MHLRRKLRSSMELDSLKEGTKRSTTENGKSLLQSLHLGLAGTLTQVKVLQGIVAALVEVSVLAVKSLELVDHAIAVHLGLHLPGLSLGNVLATGDAFLGSCINGGVGFSDKGFVRDLCILLSLESLLFHGLGISNDLFNHGHDTPRLGTLFICLESWWWRRASWLVADATLDERSLVIETLKNVEGACQELLGGTL